MELYVASSLTWKNFTKQISSQRRLKSNRAKVCFCFSFLVPNVACVKLVQERTLCILHIFRTTVQNEKWRKLSFK